MRAGKREIVNTDHVSPFASADFTEPLLTASVDIRMDSRARALGNVFVEWLWRSVKYEEVCLKDYASAAKERSGIERYLTAYNSVRIHQAPGYRTPALIYLAP